MSHPVINFTCRHCKHRQRWQCGGKIIQYCGVIRSNRTENGLRKISVKNPACAKFEIDPELKQAKTDA